MYNKVYPSIRFALLVSCFSLTVGGLFSCAKKGTTAVVAESFFVIGSGGGVSGQYIQYKVFEKGRVQLYNFELKKYIPYSTLSTSLNEKLWSQLRELNLSDVNLDQPGNYNYYIELQDTSTKNKVKWSDESEYVPNGIKQFFRTAENALREMK